MTTENKKATWMVTLGIVFLLCATILITSAIWSIGDFVSSMCFGTVGLMANVVGFILLIKGITEYKRYLIEWKLKFTEEQEELLKERLQVQRALQKDTIRTDEFHKAGVLSMQIAGILGLEDLVSKEVYEFVSVILTKNVEQLEEIKKHLEEELYNERKRQFVKLCREKQLTEINKEKTKQWLDTLSLAQLQMVEEEFSNIENGTGEFKWAEATRKAI